MDRLSFIQKSLLGLGSFLIPQLDSPPTIIFMGDSLTCYQHGWQDQVTKYWKGNSINLAQGGKRTSWMLIELQNRIPTIKADYLFIYAGINDAFSLIDPNQSINNLQQMINLSLDHQIKPVVVVGYNPAKVNLRTPYMLEIEDRCRKNYINLQQKMIHLKGCQIIPMENSITRSDSNDGIHLTASGINKFSKWVISFLTR